MTMILLKIERFPAWTAFDVETAELADTWLPS